MDKETPNSEESKSPAQLPFDPLLECLVIATKLLENPYAPETLTAGLPLADFKLTPELFMRAAERAQIDADIEKLALRKLTHKHCPAVLLLKDQQACLVTDIKDGQAEVIFPEVHPDPKTVAIADLKKNYTGQAIFLSRSYQFDTRSDLPETPKQKHWFWSVVRRYWPIYGEVLVAALLVNLFAVAVPLFVMNVYDRVVPNNATETLWVLAVGMIIVIGFEFIMRTLRAYFIDYAAKNIDVKLAAKTFAHVLGLRMDARPNSVGNLVNTVSAFESFRDFITSASISLLVDLPFVLLFLAIIFYLSSVVVIAPVVTITIILIVSFIVQKPLGELVNQAYRHGAEKQAILVESLSGAETIKAMRAEGPRQGHWERVTQASSHVNIKLRSWLNFGTNFSVAMQYLTTITVVVVGVYQIIEGNLTIGALIACTILSGRALAPVVQLSGIMIRYKQTRAAIKSLDAIMHAPTDRPEGKSFLQHPRFKGAIKFDQVCFAYPESKLAAIDDINFSINPGDHVGIIGHTGSGKTTIEKLILKLYQPTSGKILIDGTEINQIDPAELRHRVGYVPQNITLFHGSIRDNIVMAAPYVDDEAILKVAKISGIYPFINAHPDGFDRQVGERGEFLSGGQKQAVAIARALLLDPDIFIFDEPTSALDNVGIKHFIENFRDIIKGKTMILVSHKASMLKLVDRLIVMDKGKIVAQGDRDKILRILGDKQPEAKV